MKTTAFDAAADARFLRGAGGVAVGLPLLEAMSPLGRAHAQAAAPPKRFIVFFSPDGTISRRGRRPAPRPTSRCRDPGAARAQPAAHRGAGRRRQRRGDQGPGDDHMKGMGAMLTGIELLPGTTQGGCGEPAGPGGRHLGRSGDRQQDRHDDQVQVAGARRPGDGQRHGVELHQLHGREPAAAAREQPGQGVQPRVRPLGANTSDLQRIQNERKSVLDAVSAATRADPSSGGRQGQARRAPRPTSATSRCGSPPRRSPAPACAKPAMPTDRLPRQRQLPGLGSCRWT